MDLEAKHTDDYAFVCIEQSIPNKKHRIEKIQEHNFENASIDMLNDDCLKHIFQYFLVAERIRMERVCKRWRILIQESLNTIKQLNLSTWGFPEWAINIVILQKILLKCTLLKRLDVPIGCNFETTHVLNMISQYCPKLIHLDVHRIIVHTRDLKLLMEKCKEITELSLSKLKLSYTDSLDFFQKCPKLNQLKLQKLENMIPPVCCYFPLGWYLSYMPTQTMRKLIVHDSTVDIVSNMPILPYNASCFDLKQAFITLSNLEHIKIWYCHIGEKLMSAISDFCKNLTTLQIYTIYIEPEHANTLDFTNLVNLQVLELVHFPLSKKVSKNIAKNCVNIVSLDISDQPDIDPDDLEEILGQPEEDIYSMDYTVQAIATLPKLEYLYMNNTYVTDDGLQNLKNLKILTCCECKLITDKGLQKVLENSPRLRLLDIIGCIKITNDTYEAAKAICNSRPSKVALKMHCAKTEIDLTDEHTISPFLHVDCNSQTL